MKRSLVFRQIGVRRMPGFPGGGPRLDELSPGINLVHGPNASGKTTTAMALQSLLWPRTAPEGSGLEGRFELGGQSWRVDVESRRASWQRDGQDAPPPSLPPADDRDRYFLSLHGLLRADDRDLAERIRVESAGGYDVRRAGESIGVGAGGRPTSALGRRAAARDDLARAREREAALRQEGARLVRLREEQAVLRSTAARLEPLRRALALARAEERVAEAEAVLATFPPELALFRGDELERLDDWSRARESCVRAESAAEADARRAAAELEATGLGGAGVAAPLLTDVEARLDEIRRLDDEIARARDAVAEARGRRQEAGRALGIDPAASPRVLPSHADADGLDRFLQRVEALREKRTALEARLRLLTAGAPPGDRAADASAAVDAVVPILRRWLRTPEGGGAPEQRLRALVLAAALALGIAGLGLAVAGAAVPGAVWVAGVGVVLALVAAVLLVLRPAPEADGRAAFQREAERLGHGPDRWVAADVERLLDELEQRQATERVAAERRLEAERLRADLDGLVAEEKSLESERAELATRLGLEPPPEPLALHALATRLRAWDESRRKEAAAGEQQREATTRRVEAIAGAAELLQPYGYDALGAAAVEAALKDLRDRRERHQAATARLERSREERDKARGEAESLAQRQRQLLSELGLPPDGEAALRDRAERLDAYRRARSDLELAERERSVASASLDEATRVVGAGVGSLRDRAVADLERAVAEAELASTAERELAEAVAGIEARLETARQKQEIEEALAAVAEAESDLVDRRDRDAEAEVGRSLVEWLSGQDRDRNRPAVFHRARELFGLITLGRYRLDLEDGDAAAFRAYDTTTHRGHALDELSSGTRLQLLLAVRLAFVETQESGAALPLLLDEVLANCDDERASAIIDAALAIAQEGRQIFYFTAQGDELVKWRSRLSVQEQVDWCVRGIQDNPGGNGSGAPVIEWDPTRRDGVPAPEGMDHGAYGRELRVPPFDPWADGVGGLHLWYLVDDVDALHQLLAMGLVQWGQLEYLLDAGQAVPAGLSELARDVGEEARRAAAICDRFRQLWRRGRGRPVDRAALAGSGAVSDTFMEPVAALCEELAGNGAAVVEALADRRVPRFQASKTEELRAYLEARGHITDDQPLDARKIRLTLLAETDGVTSDDLDALIDRLVRGP